MRRVNSLGTNSPLSYRQTVHKYQVNPEMYETEANLTVESKGQLPQEVLSAFGSLGGKILFRTVLPWGEHCTECVWPTCYSTCDLYSPRQDGRCRRFKDGMVRIESPSAVNSYILKIRFKRVIGFAIVDRREPRMTDLMFSCRVQSKRVEHAFLASVIRKYIVETGSDFYANYRKTHRNAMSGQVFSDLGMEERETTEGVLSLRFPKEKEVPDNGVIEVSLLHILMEKRA
jgi:hypothetical protein